MQTAISRSPSSSARDEYDDLVTRLSNLSGETVSGPRGPVFVAHVHRQAHGIAQQMILCDMIAVPLAALVWAFACEILGGPLGIGVGLVIGVMAALAFTRYALPKYYAIMDGQPDLPVSLAVMVFFLVFPFGVILYFGALLLSTSPASAVGQFPTGFPWLGLWFGVLILGLTVGTLIVRIPRQRSRESMRVTSSPALCLVW